MKIRYQQVKALWYSSAGTRLLNIVVVRDPSGSRKDDCFFTTNLKAKVEEVLQTVAARWSLEVTFRDWTGAGQRTRRA